MQERIRIYMPRSFRNLLKVRDHYLLYSKMEVNGTHFKPLQ